VALFLHEGEVQGFGDWDSCQEFADWFSKFMPSEVVEISESRIEDINAEILSRQDLSPSQIWFECTDGHTRIRNGKSYIQNAKASLGRDEYCLRLYFSPVEPSSQDIEKYDLGLIVGGYFVCEACEQIDEVPDGDCDTCDNSGATWMTVYDSSAREDLDELFAEEQVEIPDWLPLIQGQ
jgi:hypothetical protein